MTQKYKKFSDDLGDSNNTSSAMGLNGTTAVISKKKSGGLSTTPTNNTSSSIEMITAEEEEYVIGVINDTTHTTITNRRKKLRRFVENVYFRIFGLILIVVDLVLLIIDLIYDESMTDQSRQWFNYTSVVFISYFVVEVTLRVYAKTAQTFFSDIYDTLDFAVIFVSFVVTIIYCFAELSGFTRLVLFGRLIRLVRGSILIRLVFTEPRNVRKGVRLAVSENKRRFRSSIFDLDLTYITDRIIAMSFPSTGKMAMYRNNMKEVAKFLDKHHGPDRYKVYNLCSERHYDTTCFHGRVTRFAIDDHNVPSLQQIAEFCADVQQWLSANEDNVIAVHCLGGKGRTGTMVCSYLVFSNKYLTSAESLNHFAERRTDKSVSEKFQGVETPSQSRYVDYFAQITHELSAKVPKQVTLKLLTIKIYSLLGVGAGNGVDFTCNIKINRETEFNLDFGAQTNCRVEYNSITDQLTVEPINCPLLYGDIRLKFNCKSKSVPRAYEECAFYLWFNTSFVSDNQLRITRDQLDNPHKEKTWKIYREHFAVQLIFDTKLSQNNLNHEQ